MNTKLAFLLTLRDLPLMAFHGSVCITRQLILLFLLPSAEAIALARVATARLLLIDEQRGRAAAKRLGLPVSGSLGVLLEAKLQGHIALIQPYLDQMIAQGRRISPQLRQQVLSLAGE